MKSKLNQAVSALLREHSPINVLRAIQEEAEQDEPLSKAAQKAMDDYRRKYKRQIDALQEANYARPYVSFKGKSRA